MGLNDFGWAIRCLKANGRVYRRGWNGVSSGMEMYLQLQEPGDNSKMNMPYIYMTTGKPGEPAGVVPWLASQTDMLATDWEAAP